MSSYSESDMVGSNDLLGTVETEVGIEGSAEDFHHMFTHKPHHISNVSSEKVQSCELHSGEWGQVGAIVFWNYHHGKYIISYHINTLYIV